ncbi:MAG: MBL fold metallo-hydrolase, partial [Campylobacterota bacterium]
IVGFVIAMPFIGNKSVDIKNPHSLDVDGNFIMYDWHYDDFKEGSRTGANSDWDYNLKPVQVSDRVWCFFGAMEMPTKENAGDMSNSCYIKGNDSWIAWDTGPSYIFAKQAHAAMKKIADLPVKTVIVSHEHDDHWLGNNYYTETQGATVYGPKSVNVNYLGYDEHTGKPNENTREIPPQTRMIRALYQNAIRGTELAPVEKHFDDTVEFTLHGIKMEYVKVGYAHSEEDWFLYLPEDKVVLVADVVMNGRVTSNRDGIVIGQLEALKAIQARDWNHLVPGHGFITDQTADDECVQYFTLLKDRVLEGIEEEIDPDYITKYVTLEEFREKDLYYLLSPGNVFRSYEELEMYDGDDEEDEEDEDEE